MDVQVRFVDDFAGGQEDEGDLPSGLKDRADRSERKFANLQHRRRILLKRWDALKVRREGVKKS